MSDPQFLAEIGSRIKKIRVEKKVQQHELAAMCNFEKASMSRIESGQTNVTIITLKKICTALEIQLSDFFKY